MWQIIVIQLVLSIGQTLSTWSCPIEKTITLVPRDYSHLPIITSNRTRSELSSAIFNYNWNDITPDIARLSDIYKPHIKVSASMPDFMPPKSLLDALENVAHNRTNEDSYKIHQYTRNKGDPRLVSILAKFSSHLMSRPIDPFKEILVTLGASYGMDLVARAFLTPGDECILFEPAYLMIKAAVENAGGKPVYVPLHIKNGTTGEKSNDWTFDPMELRSKINRKTKMIMINNPINPNGKAFTLDELSYIGYLAEKNNLVIVSDEAGAWFQYDYPGHIYIASLPGLFSRTVTINSGGKMFSNTGWKVGWVIGPEHMLWGMEAIVSNSIYAVPTPLQLAFAMSLEQEFEKINSIDSYWKRRNQESFDSLKRLMEVMNSVGGDYIVPSAGYSIEANFTSIAHRIDLSNETDCRPGMRFLTFLMKHGIAVNPCSLYYGPENIWRTEYVVRITNMKTLKTIDEFGKVIRKLFLKY